MVTLKSLPARWPRICSKLCMGEARVSGGGRYATSMARPAPPDASNEARILAAVRAIPRGQVAGYGEVARRAGLPGRARLAARVLSQNEDRRLPWHRVLRSDGRIAFPEGSEGWHEQTARLRGE